MSFEFSFASQLKTFGAGRWSLFKKKFPAKFSHLEGRMLLPFPASSAFSKGDLCCKKQLLEVISGEDPFFFCLTNQPFCAVWVQWRVTWNLQESYFKPLVFVPNVYEAKTWQGREGWVTAIHLAAPGLALMIHNSELCQVWSSCFFQSQIPSLWRGNEAPKYVPSAVNQVSAGVSHGITFFYVTI